MKLGKVLKENLEKKINKDNFKYGTLKDDWKIIGLTHDELEKLIPKFYINFWKKKILVGYHD